MIKFIDTKVVFQEIPDHITLAINISGCPIRCPDCHSKYLWEDVGEPLTETSLQDLIVKNKGIDCVCFMGGDAEPKEINNLAKFITKKYPNIKVAWYSGQEELSKDIELRYFHYIKIGPYIKEKGPLTSESSNQKLYQVRLGYINSNLPNKKVFGYKLVDITKKIQEI
jgi:anaerobic ribonucleoside-triphosphate reductase activating protein